MADHPMLRWFVADHLPPDLREVSEPFGDLARTLVDRFHLVSGFQLTTSLQRLLEAKDCAVRVALLAREEATRG